MRVTNDADAKVNNISSMGSEKGMITGEEDIEEMIIRRWGNPISSCQNQRLRRSSVRFASLVVGTVLSLVDFALQLLVNSDADR